MQVPSQALMSEMTLVDLLPVATKVFKRELSLPATELSLLLELLRLKGEEELSSGEKVQDGCVYVEKRPNGFVRVSFTGANLAR